MAAWRERRCLTKVSKSVAVELLVTSCRGTTVSSYWTFVVNADTSETGDTL